MAAIQIADGLIADCAASAAALGGPERHERWGALRTLHDGYPELWNQLDTARKILAKRGAPTTGYDELRSQVRPLAVANLDGSRPPEPVVIDDARRALEELRLAMPGADWQELEARSVKAGATRIARRGRLALVAIVCGFVLAVSVWGTAMLPKYRPNRAMLLRAELAEVVAVRRARIEELGMLIGDVCDRPRVLELMRLYVMDGRFEDAKAYGDRYELRCGEDMAVRKWANAPKPKQRD
ncbi:MAG TPA: hypothetical protein VNO30_23680 [Kofleriaceae bacterium]|nr:hypothetical protein [Kofleriaceae bacterium]